MLSDTGWNPITHIIGYCLYLDKQNICHKSSRWGWTKQWIQIQFKYICCFFKRALLKYFRTVVKWNLSVLPIFKLPCIEKNHKKKNAKPLFIFNGLFSETRIISLIFFPQTVREKTKYFYTVYTNTIDGFQRIRRVLSGIREPGK